MPEKVIIIHIVIQIQSTSRKRPPKMSSGGGRLRELDDIPSKCCLISILVSAETYFMRPFPSKPMLSLLVATIIFKLSKEFGQITMFRS